MASKLTWKEAIKTVLRAEGAPMHYRDIAERIVTEGLRSKLGATPAATVAAQISASMKREGEASSIVRISKGVFALREEKDTGKARENRRRKNPSPTADDLSDSEEQYDIVSSFGMFWRRDAVEWKSHPKLLGMQGIGATPVDFHGQAGIYLLYDGREVIYVGRSTERPLGKRLYEHTLDRMSARWDRFSWFGLLPVNQSGKLGKLPDTFVAAKMIPALESILIEAMEPRQNRKRGDDLSAVEYLQQIDPEIEKKRMRETINTALGKL